MGFKKTTKLFIWRNRHRNTSGPSILLVHNFG